MIVVVGSPGLRPVINAGVESARTRKSLGIAAGTLKVGPDVYCIDDSEIMRELQYCRSCAGSTGCVVSGHTQESGHGKEMLLKMPRSVDWLILEVGLGIGRRTIVM